MTQNSRDRGQDAERACCEYLQDKGLKLLDRNYHGRRGELDLVMQDNDTVVFVEVRYRSNNRFCSAAETITPSKQKKLRLTAEQYLQQQTRLKNGRFDVVAMTEKVGNNGSNDYSFEWIKNAF
ncbi:MAG: YraN family protein [Gammaproteobacteria bacterium]|jgi:putative endonuclease